MNLNVGLFGLGGNHSDMIIGVVNLKLFETIIVVPPPAHGGGGSGPVSVPPTQTWYDLDDDEDYPAHKRIEVNIRVRVGSFWFDRDFWMLPKNAKVVASAGDLVNTSRNQTRVAVNVVRDAFQAITVAVKQITHKDTTGGRHNDE